MIIIESNKWNPFDAVESVKRPSTIAVGRQ